MAYTIEAAKESGIFQTVMVSTESDRYVQVGREFGADVPFLRDTTTASDSASSWEVVHEVIRRYEEIGQTYDTIMLLQPTSPLRNSRNIQEAFSVYTERSAYAVVSVCEMEHSLLWCNTLPENDSMESFLDPKGKLRRQELSQYYRINGAIYLFSVEEFIKNRDIYQSRCFAYKMQRENSIDIDTEIDFKIAEIFLDPK